MRHKEVPDRDKTGMVFNNVKMTTTQQRLCISLD